MRPKASTSPPATRSTSVPGSRSTSERSTTEDLSMDLSALHLWTAMGPFARTVLALLCTMSLASLATAIERLLAVRGAAHATDAYLPRWRAVLAAPVASEARREAYDRAVRQAVLTTGSRLKRGPAVLATG